jgi:5-methylcytosine-specific restriction endonuclease McrA
MTSVQVINERAAHRRLRHAVFARDRGVCARCGRDCEAIRRRLRALSREARRLECLRLGVARGRTSLWDVHHVTPRAEGGGDALTNLATLCVWCHERETIAFASARATGRRAAATPNGLGGVYGD